MDDRFAAFKLLARYSSNTRKRTPTGPLTRAVHILQSGNSMYIHRSNRLSQTRPLRPILLFVVSAAMTCAFPTASSPGQSSTMGREALPRRGPATDLATSMAEAIDSMTITLSPKYYKAIAAVYEYRRT